MAQRRRTSIARATGKATLSAGKLLYRTTEKFVDHFVWWSTTDHLGISKSLSVMPRMGFLDSLLYIAGTLFAGLVGALAAGLTAFLLIAYGIPLLIHVLFFL